MKHHSRGQYFHILITLLLLFVMAKALSMAVLWFLPKKSPEATMQKALQMPYVHADFKNMIEADTKSTRSFSGNETVTALNINTLILKGLYGNSHYGYIIIAPKSKPTQTTILSVGESYKGYKLQGVFADYALFVKNNQKYKLYLKGTKVPSVKQYKKKSHSGNNEEASFQTAVPRSQINAYVKNPSALWRDIGIQELGKNGNFQGFKVTKLNPKSPFAKLGLHVGDVIISANNIRLKSYNDVMKIYQMLDKLQRVQLIVKRGNTQKEIVYEID